MKRIAFICFLVFVLINYTYAQNAGNHNMQGVSHYNNGDFNKAIEEFTEAIKIDPNYATAYRNRGITYKRINDYINANSDFTQVIRINPSVPDNRLNGTWRWVSQNSSDSIVYLINNGLFEYTVTSIRTTTSGNIVTTTTSRTYLKGTYIANNNTVVFIPTHYKLNNGNWSEVNHVNNTRENNSSNNSDAVVDALVNEVLRLLKEREEALNAIKDTLIKQVNSDCGSYSFSDNTIILSGRYNRM